MNYRLKSLLKCLFILVTVLTPIFSYGQNSPVSLYHQIDKPDTKFALHELFYLNIDASDIDLNEAEIDEQFLTVKNHNARRTNQGKLVINGEKVFTTDLDELPFLQNIEIKNNGILIVEDLEYYYDNFSNVSTKAESDDFINDPLNSSVGGNCIQFVVDDSFVEEYIKVINQLEAYVSEIFCCPASSPITIIVSPTDEGVASASPAYTGNHVDLAGGCNAVSENPFLTGLLGAPQSAIGTIFINNTTDPITSMNNINWHFGGGIQSDEVDLFSVLLHEFFHASGVGSRINLDGSPFGGAYSPWDLFMEINGEPILERVGAPEGGDCCYVLQPNSDFTFPTDIINASQNGNLSIAGIPVCNSDPSISGDEDFMNMLSHIDEDCTEAVCSDPNTFSDFVLNAGICLGEIRNTISSEELLLFQTMGYCTNSPGKQAPSCYVSLIDDDFVVLEGDDSQFLNVLLNDVVPTNLIQSDISLDLSCGDAGGINVTSAAGGFNIQGVIPGNYCFCYSVETCDDFCDMAEVCVLVRPASLANGCEPEDCLLNCFGDFEDFVPQINGFYFQQGIFSNQRPVFQGTGGNSVDVLSFEGNNFLHFGAPSPSCIGCHWEFVTFPLSDPVPDGCELQISFSMDCNGFSDLVVFGSENPSCFDPVLPNFESNTEQLCEGNPFYNLGFNNDQNICNPGITSFLIPDEPPTFQNFTFNWMNNSGSPINVITFFPTQANLPTSGFGRFYLDNIEITSSCENEITITDTTDEDELLVCSPETISIDYLICFTGSEDGVTTDITLTPNFTNAPIGSVSINPLSPFANGPVTINDIQINTIPCPTISLVVDIAAGLSFGQQIEVVMEIDNFDVCSQQDGEISTIITIAGETPSADFSAMIECENREVSFQPVAPNITENSFSWDFADGTTSTEYAPDHIYAQDGTYTVTLEVTGECGSASTEQVIVIECDEVDPPVGPPCACGFGGVNLSQIGTTSYNLTDLIANGTLPADGYSGCLILSGTLNINVLEYTLSNFNFILMPGSSINVLGGSNLIARSGVFRGCTELWDGITVEDQGTIEMLDIGVRDAIDGLTLLDGSDFSMQDCNFNMNNRGLVIPPNPNFNTINLLRPFIRNTFDCTSQLLPSPNVFNPTGFSFTGMQIHDVSLVFSSGNFTDLNSSRAENTFQNMNNGILSFNSSLLNFGSTFNNILPENNQLAFSGNGVYAVSSSIGSINSDFTNVPFCINAATSEVSSENSRFTDFRIGISIINALDENSFSREDEFTNYTERAIFQSNSGLIARDGIYTNQLEMPAPGLFTESISAFNPTFLNYRNNVFTLDNGQNGISVNDAREGLIRDNVIVITGFASTSNFSTGYRLSNSANLNYIENTVASIPEVEAAGFGIMDSPNVLYECNQATGIQDGMSFNGENCDDSTLSGNIFFNNGNTGLLLFNSVIGEQNIETGGNEWCGTGGAQFLGTQTEVEDSQFLVEPNTGSSGCLTFLEFPFNVNVPNWFNEDPGVAFSCNDEISTENENPQRIIGNAEQTASNQAYSGEYSEIKNWNTGLYLYEKIENYPEDLLGRNEGVDDFYNANSDNTISEFVHIRKELKNIFTVDASNSNQLEALKDEMTSVQEAIVHVDFDLLQSQNINQEEELTVQRLALNETLGNLFSNYRDELDQLAQVRALKVQGLLTLNQALATPNKAALNEKAMNKIVLTNLIDSEYIFQNNVKNKIRKIAHQCVSVGGLAVYTARGFYDLILPGNQVDFDDVDNCIQSRSENSSEVLSRNTAKVDVFPNPTDDVININIQEDFTSGTIEIRDILGSLVHSQDFDKNELTIFLENNPSGIFLLSVYLDNDRYFSEKVFVN